MKKELGKKGKIVITVIRLILVAVLVVLTIWAVPFHGKESLDHWNSKMEYTEDYAFTIEKQPGKDFEILTIADTQLSDTVDVFAKGDPYKEIEQLIEARKPDLIIVMGDITWTALTKLSAKQFIKFIDSFGIPWAPIFGNHEDETEQGYYCAVDKNWFADQFLKAENIIFKKGPNNIGGVGNYVINVTENGKIVESLIMMDTHAKRQYPEFDNQWFYDYIYDGQMDWYRWVLDGLKAQNGGEMVESMLFIHIPLCEYLDAYKAWEASGFDEEMGFGNKHEDVYCGKINSGMFDLIKEIGSTKYVFAGHDHSNNYSVLYEGVRLTYCTKTGYRTSYAEGQTGGTYITIGDRTELCAPTVNIEHAIIDYPTK